MSEVDREELERKIDALLARLAERGMAAWLKDATMSTGENINANGALLSEDMVRAGFFRFPQSQVAWVAANVWPQVAAIQIAPDYPFRAEEHTELPPGEVWFIGADGAQLGRIVNVAASAAPAPMVSQDDSLDHLDEEEKPEKTKKQKDRRIKDSLI